MKVARLETSIYRVPTSQPEADGTIHWDSTTMVLVEALSDSGEHGLGYSYASAAAAVVVRDLLCGAVVGREVEDVGKSWQAMVDSVRNVGRPGIAATAISAVDIALWDLKARCAGQPLFKLLGPYRDEVPIYGSGGFTTYSEAELATQLRDWVNEGIPAVKMKIGKDWGTKPKEDVARVEVARKAIGPDATLMVDANGAYTVKEAIDQAARFARSDVSWFEEPVSSDQLKQMAFVREKVPMTVAAGEYGYDPWYFRDMLRSGAVDTLQADATRCLGVTGFLDAAKLAQGFALPFSAHTAPTIHAQVGCAAARLVSVEYFYDHVRIENMFFDGTPERIGGFLRPDPNRPGLGIELKPAEAEPFRIEA
ncbi:MAG: enolase C-terminal domain-like protein [Chloroflexota bacterium]